MGPMLATCQNRYGKICSEERRSIDRTWFYLTRQLVVGPGKRRGSCATLSRETQAAKKKVVAGTVHREESRDCSCAGTLLITYCKYIAVSVSD